MGQIANLPRFRFVGRLATCPTLVANASSHPHRTPRRSVLPLPPGGVLAGTRGTRHCGGSSTLAARHGGADAAACRRGRRDLVILQRKLLSVMQIGILRSAARQIVFDLDDALFHRDRNQEGRFVRWKLAARFWATMLHANLVIVGNDYLRRAEVHV